MARGRTPNEIDRDNKIIELLQSMERKSEATNALLNRLLLLLQPHGTLLGKIVELLEDDDMPEPEVEPKSPEYTLVLSDRDLFSLLHSTREERQQEMVDALIARLRLATRGVESSNQIEVVVRITPPEPKEPMTVTPCPTWGCEKGADHEGRCTRGQEHGMSRKGVFVQKQKVELAETRLKTLSRIASSMKGTPNEIASAQGYAGGYQEAAYTLLQLPDFD